MFASSSVHLDYSLTLFDVFDKTEAASNKLKNSINYNIVKLHISILEAVTNVSVCQVFGFLPWPIARCSLESRNEIKLKDYSL